MFRPNLGKLVSKLKLKLEKWKNLLTHYMFELKDLKLDETQIR